MSFTKSGGQNSSLFVYECDLRRTGDDLENQAPIAKTDVRQYPLIDEPLLVPDLKIFDNDTDFENALDVASLVITQQPLYGVLDISVPGVVKYASESRINDYFRYTVTDDQGVESNEVEVVIQYFFTEENQQPIAINDELFIAPGAAISFRPLSNDRDPDGEIRQSSVQRLPAHGRLSVSGGVNPTFVYTHSGDGSIVDTFRYDIFDNRSGVGTGVVTINIGNEYVGGLDGRAIDPQEISAPGVFDWRRAGMVSTRDNLWVTWETYNAVNNGGYELGVYIDVDKNRDTGFRGFSDEYPIGVDYLVEGDLQYVYAGNGRDWSWRLVAAVGTGTESNTGRRLINPQRYFDNINGLRYFFRADNEALGGSVDYYPDSVTDTSASLISRYNIFTWLPGNTATQ